MGDKYWNGVERRKLSKPLDNFQPQTAFEGFVKATLDYQTQRLNDLPCCESSKRINAVENKISNIEGKATIFGAVGGFVMVWFSKIFLGK